MMTRRQILATIYWILTMSPVLCWSIYYLFSLTFLFSYLPFYREEIADGSVVREMSEGKCARNLILNESASFKQGMSLLKYVKCLKVSHWTHFDKVLINSHRELGALWRVCSTISIGMISFESSMVSRSQKEDQERDNTLSESYRGSLARKIPKWRISKKPGHS